MLVLFIFTFFQATGSPITLINKTDVENHPPTVTAIVDDLYCVGDYVEIQVKGVDIDGDIISYQIVQPSDLLPNGLTLNQKNGLISGKLALNEGAGSSTNYAVNVTVFDSKGAQASIVINIFVVSTCGPRVSGFSLIDASTNSSIGPLHDGDVLDLSIFPAGLSLRANVNAGTRVVKKVVFNFNSIANYRTELVEPYALAGDINGDYLNTNFKIGENVITAIAFIDDNGVETIANSLTITLHVIRSSGNHAPNISINTQDLYCRGDMLEIKAIGTDPDGDKLTYSIDPNGSPLPNNLSLDANTGIISGLLVRTNEEGSSTGYGVIVKTTDPGGLSASAFANIFSVDCGLRVSSFTLYDAATRKDVQTFLPGQTVNLTSLPAKSSLRANIYPENQVKSVVFDFNNKTNFQIERTAPYTLAGDINGVYNPVPFITGLNTITATPSFNSSGKDEISRPFTLTLNIQSPISSGPTIHTSDKSTANQVTLEKPTSVTVSPNPFTTYLNLYFTNPDNSSYTINIFNSMGQLAHTRHVKPGTGKQLITLDDFRLPVGIYTLQLMSNRGHVIKYAKVIRR